MIILFVQIVNEDGVIKSQNINLRDYPFLKHKIIHNKNMLKYIEKRQIHSFYNKNS